MNRLRMTACAMAIGLPLACTTTVGDWTPVPTAEDWMPAMEAGADWLADNGLALHGPLPAIAVVSSEDLASNYDYGMYTKSERWVAGREILAMTFTALRVVQINDRLDPYLDRSTIVRELAGIVCFEREWCQTMTKAEQEAWIGQVQSKFEQVRPL